MMRNFSLRCKELEFFEIVINEWSEFNKFDWNVSMLLRDENPTDIKNRIKFTFAIVHLGK